MATVASAEIEVTADASPFLPALKRQVRKAQASASKMGSSIGQKLGKALSKGAEQSTSRLNLGIGALIAALPLLTSAASALAGGVVAVTGSLLRAATSALSAVGVMGSLVQVALVGKLAFGGLSDAISGGAEEMAKLSPAGQALAKTLKGLSPAWQDFRNAIQQTALQGLAPMVQGIADKFLGPGSVQAALKGTGTQLNLLFKDLGKFVQSESFVKRFSGALRANNGIFATLRKAAVPLLNGLLNLYRALQPAAQRFAEYIVRVAKGFNGWTKGVGFAKQVDKFMVKAANSMRLAWRLVKNLGIALWNVTQIGANGGDGLIKTFGDLAIRFRKFTESAEGKNKIGTWIADSIKALRTFGRVIMSMGGVLGALFNPNIFGGFMSVIEKLTPTISKVAGVIGDALTPVFEKIGAAVEEHGPKIAELFVAAGPLIKSFGAILGEVIGQAIGIIGNVAAVLTPVVSLLSKYLAPVLTKLAPVIAAVILGFGGLAARLIGLLKFLGPVGALFAKMVGPIVKFAGAILKHAVGPIRILGKIIGTVFKFASKIIVGAVKLWWKIISTSFKFISKIIGSVLKFVGNLISKVFGAAGRFIVSIMKGIGSTISKAWNGIKSVTSSAISGVWSLITKGFDKVLGFIKGLPGKIISMAASFLSAGKDIGAKMIDGLMSGLSAAGGMVSDLMASIKNAINGALNLPFTIKGPGPLPDFTIPAFAKGTNFAPGGPSLVGERGPEIVNLPRGARVTPADQTRQALNGRQTINYWTVNYPKPERMSNVNRRLQENALLLGGS